jgi:hypothetical protein
MIETNGGANFETGIYTFVVQTAQNKILSNELRADCLA